MKFAIKTLSFSQGDTRRWDLTILSDPILISLLNHLRWIAALLVVISHARGLSFIPLHGLERPSLPVKLFYFFTRFGQEAVVLFFVLSGLLIAGKFLKPRLDNKSLALYSLDRVSRLWIVMIPAIALSACLVMLIPDLKQNCAVDIASIAGNALFLQDVITPPLCSNPPLWSLTNEFWYYILFPATLIALSHGPLLRRILCFIGVSAAVITLLKFDQFDDRSVLLYAPLWVMGLWAWRKPIIKINPYAALIVLIAAMCFARAPIFETIFWVKDYLIGLGVILLIHSSYKNPSVNVMAHPKVHQIGERFSAPSYSLYLIHYPVLLLCIYWLSKTQTGLFPLSPYNVKSYAIFITEILIAIAASLCLYVLFEKHTLPVRNWLRRCFKLS